MDTLKYKDYEGTVEVDMNRFVCRGKILFINDLVTYEAATPAELKREFEAAVDDYLETCVAIGRDAQKPFKGLFNVRISPALHRALAIRAIHDNATQNDVVVRSLDAYLSGAAMTSKTVNVTLTVPADKMTTFTSTAAQESFWKETVYAH